MAGVIDLVKFLDKRGLLTNRAIEQAFLSVDRAQYCPDEYKPLANLDVPIPFAVARDQVWTLPAPHYLGIALEQLDVKKGNDVLIVGARGGYLESLMAELAGPAKVRVREPAPGIAEMTQQALAGTLWARQIRFLQGLTLEPAPGETWDRIIITGSMEQVPLGIKESLRPGGYLIAPVGTGDVQVLTRVGRTATGFDERMVARIASAPFPRPAGTGTPTVPTGSRVLATSAWQDRLVTGNEPQMLRQLVNPIKVFLNEHPDLAAAGDSPRKRANDLFQLAYVFQMMGDLDMAVALYETSLSAHPTAEAHTFLGWVFSFQGRYDNAIDQCKKAIDIDPDFGNPYNDIGAYLVELGDLEQAVPWLEKAAHAKRYDCYYYPHCNLGRIRMIQGRYEEARRELQLALQLNPQYQPAAELLKQLDAMEASGSDEGEV